MKRKVYTVIVKVTDEQDTFEDLQDFIQDNFSWVEEVESLYEDGKYYRLLITTKEYFSYDVFEDLMHSMGYPVEFVEVEEA